ncbi:hypothetical protein SAMN05444487_105111 [Marininema mesophilum]|uniref:Uncharacterized protein n=1 Tax=Marininema mesophilum TaxID=1048340 RepID=A0A1H2VHF3_9BACL|nr:hypothetical protein [Marininema mesophilum]SDW67825.1 hypothetical protein SAMN05444487_105111 [Marininema mesophilum]
MKPPKLYTSRSTRKRTPRPHRKTVNRPTLSATQEKVTPPLQLSKKMDEMRTLSRQIRSYASKMDQWLSAVSNLTEAVHDKDALQNVLKVLSEIKMEKKASSSTGGKDSSPTVMEKSPPPPYSKNGDSFYDLLNSPSLPALIDKVLTNKKKRN